MTTKVPTLYDFPQAGDETALPWKWEICTHCSGHGKTSAYLGAFTSEDWAEQDDEWKDNYLAGCFDRPCDHCSGGRVMVVDFTQIHDKAKRAATQKAWNEQCRSEAQERAAERAEYLFCGGWRDERGY